MLTLFSIAFSIEQLGLALLSYLSWSNLKFGFSIIPNLEAISCAAIQSAASGIFFIQPEIGAATVRAR